MKIKFLIDENYLIIHTLSSMRRDRFSSQKHRKDIVDFQDYAWKKSKQCYNLLVGRLSPEDVLNHSIQDICKELPKFLNYCKSSVQYKKILKQTQKYSQFCKRQWDKNYPTTSEIMKAITGFKFNKTFKVYVTHPSLRNGSYPGDNVIEWGHHEDWPNYATVYLWHEILHSYFGRTDVDHAIIQLITDEELRIRLNGGKYPPFAGHKNLILITKKILPYWKKYLRAGRSDILKFTQEMKKALKK